MLFYARFVFKSFEIRIQNFFLQFLIFFEKFVNLKHLTSDAPRLTAEQLFEKHWIIPHCCWL